MKLVFEKTAMNPFHKSKYCPLPKLWEKLEPILTEKKLLVYFIPRDWKLITLIKNMESNEDPLTCELEIWSKEAQRMGSDITYFKRYSLWCIFNIITDEDIDGNKWPSKAKKVFTEKQCWEFKKRTVWKEKAKIMQEILRLKKDYEIPDEIAINLDLFLKDIK